MICCFCSEHIDTRDEAIDAGWIPSFYASHIEYEGPVCVGCQRHLKYDGGTCDFELLPGVPLPTLAIELKRHPNKG